MKIPWCATEDRRIEPAGRGEQKAGMVRCAKCGKRLHPRTVPDPEVEGGFALALPKHKVPAAKVKRKKPLSAQSERRAPRRR